MLSRMASNTFNENVGMLVLLRIPLKCGESLAGHDVTLGEITPKCGNDFCVVEGGCWARPANEPILSIVNDVNYVPISITTVVTWLI